MSTTSDHASGLSSALGAAATAATASITSSLTPATPPPSSTTDGGIPPSSNSNQNAGGPTSSPLLFFVALGFGVVFTNLWIIVGVKYCFRYNQRNRALRAAADGEPIDLTNMTRPHRRRREKKLMTMDEVNERFPTTKYKAWRSQREMDGLPAAGGIDRVAAASRAASIKDADGTIEAFKSVDEARKSADTARPVTARSASPPPIPVLPTITTTTDTTNSAEKSAAVVVSTSNDHDGAASDDEDDEDDDDPIRAAATASQHDALAHPSGDTCAICLDNLDDDDDIRGLTCGHAFHTACVDPWLTGRRACCPLCKADYYVPKPRAEGEADAETAALRAQTERGWLGARYLPARPSLVLLTGQRGNSNAHGLLGVARRSPRSARSARQEADPGGLALFMTGALGAGTTGNRASPGAGERGGGWRSRLTGLASRWRSAGAASTPGQLEAGTGAGAGNTTMPAAASRRLL